MPKIGLVLSGGGGKGPYQVGVWKALKKVGFAEHISVISGTSIGALNAYLLAQDKVSIEKMENGELLIAEKLWYNIKTKDFAEFNKDIIIKAFSGIGINKTTVNKLASLIFSKGIPFSFKRFAQYAASMGLKNIGWLPMGFAVLKVLSGGILKRNRLEKLIENYQLSKECPYKIYA